MSHEHTSTIMSTYLDELLGKGRFDLVAELAADDVVDHTQPHLSSAAALDAHPCGFWENRPDLRVDVLKIIATETSAVGIWRWDGEPHHPSAVSASGAPVISRLVASVFEIEDGRIAEYRAFVDAVDRVHADHAVGVNRPPMIPPLTDTQTRASRPIRWNRRTLSALRREGLDGRTDSDVRVRLAAASTW